MASGVPNRDSIRAIDAATITPHAGLLEQRERNPLQAGRSRCLDEYDVARLQVVSQHANASSTSSTKTGASDQDRSSVAPRCIGTSTWTYSHDAIDAEADREPTDASLLLPMRSPSSRISPSTAQVRRPLPIVTSAFSAARTESGLALYASLITVTPSGSVDDFHPPPALRGGCARRRHLRHVEPGRPRDARGAEGVADVVFAVAAQVHLRATLGVSRRRRPGSMVEDDVAARTSAPGRIARMSSRCLVRLAMARRADRRH